ncbi:MAG TPA: prepilin-type N-terminal cleavage/methylation domain-containing protein [Acidimicrobiales bacterium]
MTARPAAGDGGFSLTEVMVSLVIFSAVLASVVGMLSSFTATERRGEAQAANQAAVRLAVAALERDVRDATGVGLLGSAAAYAETLLLTVDGGCVRWEAADGELARSEESPCGTVTTRRVLVATVEAVGSAPVFAYHRPGGEAMDAGETAWDFATCAARVVVRFAGAADDLAPPFPVEGDARLRAGRPAAC